MATVSKSYGHALVELAIEQNRAEQLLEEAKTVDTVLQENPEVLRLYNHPKITMEEKQAFTETCFLNRISDDMTGFLVLAVKNGRQNELRNILAEVISELKEYLRIGIVLVTTPYLLPFEQRKRLEEKLLATTSYKTLEMNYSIDASLIGGIVIRIGDRVVDSSIRTQLSGLQKELKQVRI